MDIFFWDIDGTLIRTSKAGLYAFEAAVREQWGKPVDYSKVHSAGMTDYSIARQIIEVMAGRPSTHQEVKRLTRRYEEILAEHLAMREGKIMPSVREILATLQEKKARSLLLTGNSRTGALMKLRKFGLEEFFDFTHSAFCEDSPDRDDVARRALENAKRLAATQQARLFVIGDTPNDIRCGKMIDAYTIGVATGTFSEPELAAHDPWWSLPHLPPAPEFMKKLAGIEPTCFRRE